jgi:tetratricopeptide (TPR) repeat protein
MAAGKKSSGARCFHQAKRTRGIGARGNPRVVESVRGPVIDRDRYGLCAATCAGGHGTAVRTGGSWRYHVSRVLSTPARCGLAAVAAIGVVMTMAASRATADDKGLCFTGTGDKAIAACTRRIAFHIKNSAASNAKYNLAVVYYSRSWLYYNKMDYKRALADSDKSWRADPSFGKALYLRGLAKEHLNDVSGGEADIARAIAIDPNLKKVPHKD